MALLITLINAGIALTWATKSADVELQMPDLIVLMGMVDQPERLEVAPEVAFFKPRVPRETACARMKQQIDSDIGRHEYSKRLGTVEPPNGHIQGMGFRRIQRRGQAKVNAEWLMICTVHNMKRIHQCRQRAG